MTQGDAKKEPLGPMTLSVAGFKAIPHTGGPVIHMPGVTVLTGTNSSGKSALMHALRLLRESLVHEPAAERLHLRAPGLPAARMESVWSLYPDWDIFRPIRYRFTSVVEGTTVLLELAYRSDDVLSMLGTPIPREARELAFPPTVPLQASSVSTWQGNHVSRATVDPWAADWVAVEDPSLHEEMLRRLRSWALSTAAIDSIRGRPLTAIPQSWPFSLTSACVFPDGSNAEMLIARDSQNCGTPADAGDWADFSEDLRGYSTCETALRILTQYLGLEELKDNQMGPGMFPEVVKRIEMSIPFVSVEDTSDASGDVVVTYRDGARHRVPRTAFHYLYQRDGNPHQRSPRGLAADFRHRFHYHQTHRITDLGDGQQQVLPALLQLFLSEPGTCLLWEHPDLHLHPGASTQLGRLIHMVGQAGRSVVLETHSRDLIDGLRLQGARHRIHRAQAAARQAEGDSVTESEPAPVHLVSFRRQEDGMVRPTVHDLADPAAPMPWPEGFVDAEILERAAFEEQMATRLRPADPRSVQEFIAQNEEGACVEYKAALRWNHHAARHEDEVKQSLLKALCAFLNTHGGQLFVGVDDDRKLVGIEHDTDGQRNDEKFQRMLVELVAERIDPTAFPRFMDIAFVELEGKAVAVVTCRPADEPMYLRDQQTLRFFVRSGNTSREFSVADAIRYQQQHFVR